MSRATQPKRDNQAAQKELVEQARRIPGVADAMDVHERLAPYLQPYANVQLSQLHNATGGNVAYWRHAV
jgi:hypothetical protein